MDNSINSQLIASPTYLAFIWKNKSNKALLLLAVCISAGLFGLFKLFYPFPDFFGDSYSYIYAAGAHLNINIWPIGYSKFLGWFHCISYSGIGLVAFQYFAMQLASIHFLFTLLYFYELKTFYRNVLAIFLLVNPLTLYLCNTINSDALFGCLSLLWVTELIWIIERPMVHQIFSQAILLFFCFTIRNNAYYYPVIGSLTFFLSRQTPWRKAVGIVLPLMLLFVFISFTRQEAFKLTGIRQFSLFTGWQLANNALYMYDQIDVDSADLPTVEARSLNRYAIQYFRRVNYHVYRSALENYVGNFFIRQPEAPLKQYYGSHYKFTTGESTINIRNWAHASATFEPFGRALILKHPVSYVQYFMFPNVRHYLLPPLSHVGLYNYGIDVIDPVAANWFHYPTNKIRVTSHGFQGQLLLVYIGLFLLLNVYYMWNVVRGIFQRSFFGWRARKGYALSLFFLIINFGFSIASTVNILRYQYVPMFVLAGFGLALGSSLEPVAADSEKKVDVGPQVDGFMKPIVEPQSC